jgi:glutamate-5-semialdehyde dehydrogenase
MLERQTISKQNAPSPVECSTLTLLADWRILRKEPNSRPGKAFRVTMPIAADRDLVEYCRQVASRAKAAAAELALARGEQKNAWLRQSAERLRGETAALLAANASDIAAAPGFGLSDTQIDRLRLTTKRIEEIAMGLEAVAALPDPVGEVIESSVRPNGLEILKTRVPLGVVFFIYESRPNVTADAAAICLKSGNAVILRGGKEAAHSSAAIVEILREMAADHGLPEDALQLVDTPDRAAVGHFLSLPDYIDVAIPRGGESLIRRVVAEARMPVIKHFTGNCHVYVDASADLDMAERITINAKCQRMGVCNACESLLVHAAVADAFLPRIGSALAERGIEMRADARARPRLLVPGVKAATEEDYAAEYLGPTISIRVVESRSDAIEHINRYGSKHTDAIVTQDLAAAREFAARVDSSAVMINASTRFNDGYEFGLGAEIGISTDKFHARGPCGLKELTTYKYVVFGEGQIRE